MLMLMMMTTTLLNVDVPRLICGGWQWRLHLHNESSCLSFRRAVDGGENNKCLPQINNSGRGAAKQAAPQITLSVLKVFLSLYFFLFFSRVPCLTNCFVFDQKFRCCCLQQRLSFLSAETKPRLSCRCRPRRLQTANLPALLQESDWLEWDPHTA